MQQRDNRAVAGTLTITDRVIDAGQTSKARITYATDLDGTLTDADGRTFATINSILIRDTETEQVQGVIIAVQE